MGKRSADRQLQSAHKTRRKWDDLGAREDGEERSTKGANTKSPIVLRRSPISSLHYSSHFSLVLFCVFVDVEGFPFLFFIFYFFLFFIFMLVSHSLSPHPYPLFFIF